MSGMETLSRWNRTRGQLGCLFAIAFAFLVVSILVGCLRPEPGSSPASEPLRIGTSGDYAPFSAHAEAERTQPRGFSIDLGEAYARATGRRVTWVPFAWPDLADDLRQGRFDLALSGVTVRADRSIAGRFSLPITVSGAVLLVPADGPLAEGGPSVPIERLSEPGLRFAVNAGGHLERTARRLFPQAEIVPIADNGAVLERIEEPGIAGVLTDSLEAPHWLARRPGLVASDPLTRDRKAAWFPIEATRERDRFDAWLLEAERDGTLATLRRRHALPEDRTAATVPALLARLDERLSLMNEVARVKQVMGRPIEDRSREATVLDAALTTVRNEASARATASPDPDGVRAFYQAQMEAAKSIQRAWTAAHPGSHAAPADAAYRAAKTRLEKDLRPALIDLGDGIAGLVVRAAAEGEPAPSLPLVRASLARHDLPRRDLEAIQSGLAGLLSGERQADGGRTSASRAIQ